MENLFPINRSFLRNDLIKWVEISVRPSNRPSVRPSVTIFCFLIPSIITEPIIFRLHIMILDIVPHNRSVRFLRFPVTWLKNAVKMPYGIYLFPLLLLSRLCPNFVSWYKTMVRTLVQRPISRFPDMWPRNGVRCALTSRISDMFYFNQVLPR